MKIFKKKKPKHGNIHVSLNVDVNDNFSEGDEADLSFISFEPPISSTQRFITNTSDGADANANVDANRNIPLSSYHDDGQPTYPPDAHRDILRVMELIQQERHLAAYRLYLHTIQTIETHLKFQNDKSFGLGSNSDEDSNEDSDEEYNYFSERKRKRKKDLEKEKSNPSTGTSTCTNEGDEFNIHSAQSFLSDPQNVEILQRLQQRAQIFHRAKANATRNDNWIPSMQIHGITSSYRHENDGSLSLKVEGQIMGLPLFEQVAVMRELDLYHTWAPVCSKSKKICSLGGKLDTVGWLEVGTSLLSRDACYRAIGCDCMFEDGCVVVVAQGLHDDDNDGRHGDGNRNNGAGEDIADDKANDPPLMDNLNHAGWTGAFTQITTNKNQKQVLVDADNNSVASSIRSDDMHHLHHIHTQNKNDDGTEADDPYIDNYLARDAIMETIELPPKPKGFNAGRMNLKFFEAVIEVSSPTTANTRLVANVDLNIKILPRWALDFIMKHMCGLILLKLQHAARKATCNSDSHHAKRMREDPAFYKDWLLPKFEGYCEKMGWELPFVYALSESDTNGDSNDRNDANVKTNGISDTSNMNREISPNRETNHTRATHDETASTRSKFSKQWNKIRNKRIGKWKGRSGGGSVQSAPVVSARDRQHNREPPKSPFSKEQQKRLEDLKRFKLLLESNSNGRHRNVPPPLQSPLAESEQKNHPYIAAVTHLISDYSKAATLSLLFTVMLFAYHSASYDVMCCSDDLLQSLSLPSYLEVPTQFVSLVLMIFAFCFLHWAVIQAILVSAFDTIELPVVRRHFDDSSSNMRLYFMQQTRLPTIMFSVSLAFVSIMKNLFLFTLRMILTFLRWTFLGQEESRENYFPTSTDGVVLSGQILQDAKSMMTYTAVFVLVCYLFARASYPTKDDPKGSYKNTIFSVRIRNDEVATTVERTDIHLEDMDAVRDD